MKRLILLTLLLLSVMAARPQSDHYISPTKYDWSNLATSLTAGKSTNRDKFHAIYRWLCDNIAYDTSYSIYTADECYEKRRGVCQAYSELFVRLSEAVGLKAVIVSGYSKKDGEVSPNGHAWVFAYTDPASGKGMLIDPTWGAGYVEGSVFTHQPNDDSWFHVDPHYMIFTHYPKDEAYQLLGDRAVSMETFSRLPEYKPSLEKFGFDGEELFKAHLAGRPVDLPKCYSSTFDEFGIERAQIPSNRRLKVGQPISLALKTKLPVDNFIMIGEGRGPNFNKGEWQRQGDYLYCRFMPAEGGEVGVGVLNSKGTYSYIVSFDVDAPTASDVAKLEATNPELSPLWAKFQDCRPEVMRDKGVNLSLMLDSIRKQRYTELPTFYSQKDFKVGLIPYNGILRVGVTYSFEFTPHSGSGTECAVIVGSDSGKKDWYYDWDIDPRSGRYRITVTPQQPGELKVSAKASDGMYYAFFKYRVR